MTTPQEMKRIEKEKNQMSEKVEKRKGVQTSEFWLTLATGALSLAIIGGWIDLEGVSAFDKIAAMVVMALEFGRLHGRSKLGQRQRGRGRYRVK